MINIDEVHKQLLEAQNTHPPQLTIREMGSVLDNSNPSHVAYILEKLVEAGLAEKVQRGMKHVYRILPQSHKHNGGRHD